MSNAPMLRIHLPPNLPAAAARDAIALRVDFDPSGTFPPQLIPALALLQRWCGAASGSPLFLQVTRRQLAQLTAALRGQAGFVSGVVQHPQALAWDGDVLPGVSEHLTDPAPPADSSVAPMGKPRRPEATAPANAAPAVIDGSEHFVAVTLPAREHPSYEPLRDLVKTSGFILETSNRRWWLRDRHKALSFLARHGRRLREEFEARFTENFAKNCAHISPATFEVEAHADASGEQVVTLSMRAGAASESQLREALAADRGYLEDGGRVYLVEPEALARLAEAQRRLAGAGPRSAVAPRSIHRVLPVQLAAAQEAIEALAPSFQPPAEWVRRSSGLRNLSTLEAAPIEGSLARRLRPYQSLGVAWLWHLFRHGLGGVLADEMGLGKTLQALGLLTAIHRVQTSGRPPRAPSLVVAPASLLENWRREAARFAPSLRVLVHHGSQRDAGTAFGSADVVITSYGTLARDRAHFEGIEFASITADEAQHIKNRQTRNAAALRALRSPARFVLTGTPLENSLDDLRSLFEFLLPGYLAPLPGDARPEERSWYRERLLRQAAPYILRRTKSSVAPELPPRLEQVLWCQFSPSQEALYRAEQQKSQRALMDLADGGASENRIRLAALTELLRLRQICCDPRLLPAAPQEPAPDSTKLEAFRELLSEALDDGHRLLVFSQFTSFLALVRQDLEKQGVACCSLDGSMPVQARQAEVDRFQGSSDIPVFLLSLKAGGSGLNLTGADVVVHLDPWWNPAAEAQATDRAHRIGQTRTVVAYKLIVAGSVEEKVLGLQESKRALLAGVFEASDAISTKLSIADLQELLSP